MTLITYTQGENRRLVGIVTADDGTILIQGTPTITIWPEAGGDDVISAAACSGFDPGAAQKVEAWYFWDMTSVAAGFYNAEMTIHVTDQDGRPSTMIASGSVEIRSLRD